MCQYFSKTEDQCSQTMEQATKEAVEKNRHHHVTMKTIIKAYLSNKELLYFTRIEAKENFPNSYFINTNLPEERVQVFKSSRVQRSEKELRELPDESPNSFQETKY